MDSVFLVWHVHSLPDQEDDEKLIGAYRTKADAQDAIQRVKGKPGFRDVPDGFVVDEYPLNLDHWPDGYITVWPGTHR